MSVPICTKCGFVAPRCVDLWRVGKFDEVLLCFDCARSFQEWYIKTFQTPNVDCQNYLTWMREIVLDDLNWGSHIRDNRYYKPLGGTA